MVWGFPSLQWVNKPTFVQLQVCSCWSWLKGADILLWRWHVKWKRLPRILPNVNLPINVIWPMKAGIRNPHTMMPIWTWNPLLRARSCICYHELKIIFLMGILLLLSLEVHSWHPSEQKVADLLFRHLSFGTSVFVRESILSSTPLIQHLMLQLTDNRAPVLSGKRQKGWSWT